MTQADRWQIVDADPCHLRALARTLRSADAAEVAAYGSGSAMKVIWHSWKRSTIRKTVLVDGEVAAVGGVVGSLMGGKGMPWLLTSPAIERMPVTFARELRREVAGALAAYPELENYVHAPYRRALRLMEWAGFVVEPAEPVAETGEYFHRIHMTRTA